MCGVTLIELFALAAKPVVDIQVSVADLDDEDRYVPPCEAAGFQPRFRGNGCTYRSATTFGARGGARDTYAAAKREAGRLWAGLENLKDFCWWHHHVVLHQMGWVLTAHADGTSEVRSPGGKTIRSHDPPPRPG